MSFPNLELVLFSVMARLALCLTRHTFVCLQICLYRYIFTEVQMLEQIFLVTVKHI